MALPLIATIALIFRLIPLRFKYMLGYDPYFHLAYIREALKAGEWFNFLTIAGGPWGYQVHNFHPLGLWMTPAYVYKLLSIFGVSLYDAFRITPVIFGVLTVIFFYLALLKLYDEKRAFFASLFLAVSFGHVFRSMANYYRGDNYMLFLYSLALLGTALALKTRRSRRYRKLAFYLVPALASGFASIFWQAYYPIFIFLLANSLFLAVGAFLLKKDKYMLDSLCLALSTALGALMANYLAGSFGYGMLGYNRWLGKKVAEKLSLEFGLIKDVYLLVHLKYLLPLGLAFIVLLLILGRFVKSGKVRLGILSVLALLGVLIIFARFEALKDLSTGFGIFKEAPIQETRPSGFSDLWGAFSIGLFLAPLFFLRFTPRKVKVYDFLLLGLIIPSIYMIKTWTRFLFIGSMGIALMAGIGLMELYELPKLEGRKGMALTLVLLVLLPITDASLGFQRAWEERPRMNGAWENALVWLENNSNGNDIVMAWWDYGHWVTYYSRRSPVAQGSPNRGVARYYIGRLDENWAGGLGVDYVIVSYYDFLKFGAIVETANVKGDYGMVVLPLLSSSGAFIFQKEGYSIVAKPGETWEVLINVNGQTLAPVEAYIEYGEKVERLNTGPSKFDAYVYMNLNYGYAVLMNGEAFNTTLARLFIKPEEPYELAYSDGGIVKILRLRHPNVIVKKTGGKVLLEFENATGTGLGIWGYLDNGTQVFKKWYPVKGLEEFELPGNMNGSVVVRYTYVQGKKVLDRGIFRMP
ncbi:oligosaccharyl transferase, STT3 subunit [Thermococcus sp. P6]|uniref:STT3 domain-containing protein n=1 Tax=Thermococcus sp. P6 TaxID=122420 RepID=UPI000B59D66B|nr:STT3 domain-containing protein [Thermococcus sp. P6]ASJ10305.1 oligosaccharyl transferase, STT3 subunit [Thermococcus sp. P6]